jgi:hypothetical protein
VPGEGFEPSRLTAQASKTCMASNYINPAWCLILDLNQKNLVFETKMRANYINQAYIQFLLICFVIQNLSITLIDLKPCSNHLVLIVFLMILRY